MDIEKAREILESDDNERIYENDFSKGVAIISKYADTKFGYQFQHDQMWYGDFENWQNMGGLKMRMVGLYFHRGER
jgi:hypothetical protein